MKVNIWQVGYTTCKDWVLRQRQQAQCQSKGYVLLEDKDRENDWEELVWHLLNWSCWTEVKPESIHSPLDHCNTDVILQIEGEKEYSIPKFMGFEKCSSLDEAAKILQNSHELWPFSNVEGRSGSYTVRNGKALWSENDIDWEEVTW